MDNRDLELLQAIQLMIDPLKDDMQGMKGEIQGMKGEMQGMKGEMQGVKGEIKDIKERLTNVEEETRRTSLILENRIAPALQALAEGYMPLVDKIRHVPEDIEDLENRVSLLEFVHQIKK